MLEWTWEARARGGEVRRGVMEAESQEIVEARLRSQNLTPSKVKKKGKELSLAFGSPVSEKELAVFVRQFATMIDAGLPIVRCLEMLSNQGSNKAFVAVLKDIKGQVETGATLSDSLKRHPKVFDVLFCNLVAAGEIGGVLDTILNRLAQYIEKRAKLKSQVKGALVYPVGVMFIAIAVLVVLLVFVIPTFKSMFKDFGAADDMPTITKFVIGMSEGFITNIPYIILGAGAIFGTIWYTYNKSAKGKTFWHRAFITGPIIGPVMRKIAVARFTRTLGTLLSSGVPILEALNIVAKASGNVIVERAIFTTLERIREGSNMAEPLGASGVFPPMVVQMIAIGEESGAVDGMLSKIADFYEEEVDVAVGALTSMLEPLMMVVIGGMVGFMLIAMYMPIFDIAGKIKGG